MFLDSEDYEHLINQLNKDLPLLKNKLVDIRTKIYKQLRKGKYIAPRIKSVEWRNHATHVKWTIYCNIAQENGPQIVRLIPITEYNNKEGKKDYFVCCLDFLIQKLAESHLFKVFRGHFISRYLERTHSTNETPHLVIFNFMMIQNIGINYHYNQNEKWLLYLGSKGIAMIREDRLCLVFDTFLTFPELKPDQNQAIMAYADELLVHKPEDFCIVFLHLLLGYGIGWEKFFTEEKLLSALKKLEKSKPSVVQAFTQQMYKFYERHSVLPEKCRVSFKMSQIRLRAFRSIRN